MSVVEDEGTGGERPSDHDQRDEDDEGAAHGRR
jgi:hypothetical protein